jgi:hypothetical protein
LDLALVKYKLSFFQDSFDARYQHWSFINMTGFGIKKPIPSYRLTRQKKISCLINKKIAHFLGGRQLNYT